VKVIRQRPLFTALQKSTCQAKASGLAKHWHADDKTFEDIHLDHEYQGELPAGAGIFGARK
jgi:hypothetical protein